MFSFFVLATFYYSIVKSQDCILTIEFRDRPSTNSMSFCLFLLSLCFLYLYYLLDFAYFFSDTIKCDEWMNVAFVTVKVTI